MSSYSEDPRLLKKEIYRLQEIINRQANENIQLRTQVEDLRAACEQKQEIINSYLPKATQPEE